MCSKACFCYFVKVSLSDIQACKFIGFTDLLSTKVKTWSLLHFVGVEIMVKNFTDVMTRRILRMSKVVSGTLLAHDTLVLTFFFVRNFCCEKSRSFKTVVFNGVAERKSGW